MKCLDVVKEDMREVGAIEDEVFDRNVLSMANPLWRSLMGKLEVKKAFVCTHVCLVTQIVAVAKV